MSVRISDIDHGYRRVLTNVRKLGRTTVRVGVTDAPHAGSNLRTDEIAAIHEFSGRSFLRAWVDQNQRGVRAWLKEHLYRFIMGTELWADNFGKYAVEGIRARIRLGIPPPLQEATIKRKERRGYVDPATPLIATEHLIKGIEYDVKRDGDGR